jgi:hypothetical protein
MDKTIGSERTTKYLDIVQYFSRKPNRLRRERTEETRSPSQTKLFGKLWEMDVLFE